MYLVDGPRDIIMWGSRTSFEPPELPIETVTENLFLRSSCITFSQLTVYRFQTLACIVRVVSFLLFERLLCIDGK